MSTSSEVTPFIPAPTARGDPSCVHAQSQSLQKSISEKCSSPTPRPASMPKTIFLVAHLPQETKWSTYGGPRVTPYVAGGGSQLRFRTVESKYLIIFHGLGEGICCPLRNQRKWLF